VCTLFAWTAIDVNLTLSGLLHLLYSCVSMMFWRVFMRISYSCPAHLKFAMTIEQWTELVNLASECIDWLDAHERIYDIWLIVAYAATSCALVQVPPICELWPLPDSLQATLVPYFCPSQRRPSTGQVTQTPGLHPTVGRCYFT
jgi:hypothetical protein